jgi:dTDP-4-amino-4,6-dideoxygalactose transaminase
MKRIYLSPPHMFGEELELVKEVFESNWIAPLGPQVDAFEKEMSERTGVEHAVALSSGTAALHLALGVLGVEQGDDVICSTLTFAASANAIKYVGANPVFVDSNKETWNMDPGLLENELGNAKRSGRLPKAAIIVDLYGQCADYNSIEEICRQYEVPIIEDAAEALGATCNSKPAGSFGQLAILSFNGNKIITSSGGGMLLTNRKDYAEEVLHLATQARDPAPHYQHSRVGYNYRMSNVLAAIGRGQLQNLEEIVKRRRRNYKFYCKALGEIPGIQMIPEAEYGRSNCWLTCITVDPDVTGVSREDIRLRMEKDNIEARPVWKPMHMQPVFKDCRVIGGSISEEIFENGLCLPSGTGLSDDDRSRIVESFVKTIG